MGCAVVVLQWAAAQHRFQRTRLAAWGFERKRARRGLLLKVRRRSHRAAEPGSLNWQLNTRQTLNIKANIASRPTAPLARAGGGETRFGACLLAKGFSTQSARRLMLTVMGKMLYEYDR